MEEFVLFICSFLGVYIIYLLFVVLRKKQLKKYRTSTEVRFLEGAYHINMDHADMKVVANIMAVVNALIISLTVTLVSFLPNTVLKLLVGFVILIVLILVIYAIVGKWFQKKYGVKPKKKRK